MGSPRVHSELSKKGKNQIPSLPNGDKFSVQKSFFGVSSDIDILAWLKGVALDPCNPQASRGSVRKLHDQALNTWKVLVMSNNAECPRKKRKFELFLKGSNFTDSSRPFEEKSNNRSTKKVSGTSCVSYSLNSYDGTATCYHSIGCSLGSGGIMIVEDNFQGKPMKANLVCSDNAKNSNPSGLSCAHLDETRTSLENPIDDSVQNSDSLSSGIYMTPQQAVELLITTGECPPRSVIPIGPRFQAQVPDWGSIVSKTNYKDDPETLKWLGKQCWPREGARVDDRANAKAIGKGRPNSCSCLSPGSVDCVKRHVSEARRRLKSDLGPMFLTWKFYEMGETVSSSWTLKEQERFESLVKENPLTVSEDFWDRATKTFPSKSMQTLLKYYYNVLIPRRMRIDARSASSARDIVSDDDDPEESDDDEPGEHGKVSRFLRTCRR